MNLRKQLLLYGITHREYIKDDFYNKIEDSLKGGVRILQVREKNLREEEFIKEVLQLKPICKKYHVPIIINDSLNVLEKTDAEGIHIGQKDEELKKVRALFPDKIIGVSVKTVEDALKAERDGADYLGVGAMFKTPTKTDTYTIPMKRLEEISNAVNIPVVAIGGCNRNNIKELNGKGISGVAVISDLYNSKDVYQSAKELYHEVRNITIKKVLTIAGSDSIGGAGVQADLKTFTAHHKYGMSVITAITAQNTKEIISIENLSKEMIKDQLIAVFNDMIPDSIKIGMLPTIDSIQVVSEMLSKYPVKNIVIDPVMVSTSNKRLIEKEAVEEMKKTLFKKAALITPNIPEAEMLSGKAIHSTEDMKKVAKMLGDEFCTSILVKGGHLKEEAVDILYTNGEIYAFSKKRVDTKNTHGTGCTLSSAIASNLADYFGIYESVKLAKEYTYHAIKNDLFLGSLNHMWRMK